MPALQQQLLKEGAAVLHLEANDPCDLAQRAELTASSESTHTSGEHMAATKVTNGFARAVGERMKETTNAWRPDPNAAGPHWVQLNWREPVMFNMLHITFQTAESSPGRFQVEAHRQDNWIPISEIDQNRHRRHVLGFSKPILADALRLIENEPAGVCEIRVYNEPQRLVEIAQRAHANMRLPDEGPWLPWGD